MPAFARTRHALTRASNRVFEILQRRELPADIRGLADLARRDLIEARRTLPDDDADDIENELTPREQALAEAAEAERASIPARARPALDEAAKLAVGRTA